jgi:hypothetical protein
MIVAHSTPETCASVDDTDPKHSIGSGWAVGPSMITHRLNTRALRAEQYAATSGLHGSGFFPDYPAVRFADDMQGFLRICLHFGCLHLPKKTGTHISLKTLTYSRAPPRRLLSLFFSS